MIEFKDVSFSYPGRDCLFDRLNVCFEQNLITAIIGPNGCGKSTMLKLASRLLRPTKGSIQLGCKDLQSFKRGELAKEVTLLSQSHSLPTITVRELVSYGRYPHSGGRLGLSVEDERYINQAMQLTHADEFADQTLHRISGGQCQRAFIAMALAQDTEVLLLDEPTNALDIHVCFEIMDLITSLKQAGKTIIMVLHDLPLALQYADRILLMHEGKPIAYGKPEELISEHVVDDIFQVRTYPLTMEGQTIFAVSGIGHKYATTEEKKPYIKLKK